MDIHKPKPWHGLREFLKEYLIIVVGVLTALAAEQTVEKLHEHMIADETRTAIRAELEDNLAGLVRRQEAEPCVRARLGEIRGLLRQWANGGRFDAPSQVGAPPVSPIRLTRYDAAVSAGRIALLPSQEQYGVGYVAVGLRSFGDTEHQERQVWGRLAELREGPAVLSAADRTGLRLALSDAETLDMQEDTGSRQILVLARGFGYKPDGHNLRRTLALSGFRPKAAICDPVGSPPMH
jgi:hypothetical protein